MDVISLVSIKRLQALTFSNICGGFYVFNPLDHNSDGGIWHNNNYPMIHKKEKWTNILLFLIAYLPILIFFNLIFIDVCSWKLSLGLSSLHLSFILGVHVFLHHHKQTSCSMTAPKYICQTLLPNCLIKKGKKVF